MMQPAHTLRIDGAGSAVLNDFRAAMQYARAQKAGVTGAVKPTRMVPARRSFAAADVSNLTASFTGVHGSLNQTLEHSLRLMRARSRKLANDNDYVKQFLRMVQNHVIGPQGFSLAVNCQRPDGSIDENDKAVCEKVFKKWSKRGSCDVTGRLSFTQLCRLVILLVARDGEALVRRIKRRGVNDFGYALQVLDPVLLDENYRADFSDGRRVRLGVETNAEGKPLAYHLRGDLENSYSANRVRVDASEIWHLFVADEPSQVRGVPWIHTAMRRLNDMGGYEEAAVIAARVGASNMGFYVPPADAGGNAAALADEIIKGVNANGDATTELVKDATPGTFEELPPGYDFKKFDPDYPHTNFDPFIKAMLRGVASGTGVDYGTLSNDLVGATYSSIRTGKLETQDSWMCIQRWFDECLLDPLWPELLNNAFLSNQMGSLPVSKYDKYNVAVWQGRRWPWVDPKNDMQATVLELTNGLTSFSAVMREKGRDPEATWRELEKDLTRLKPLLDQLNPPAPVAAAQQAQAPAAEN